MSDKEASPGAESETIENEEGSPAASNEDNDSPKISVSRSASRSPSHSKSRSRSASEEKPSSKKRSRSRSSSGSRRRRRSPDRSRKRSYRSRSRSYERRRSSRDDYYYDEGRGGRNYGYDRRSPFSYRKRHRGDRENPGESRCLGVFGLSLHTQERDLRDIFSHYGPVENVQVVYDHQTGRSRGFAFIYMKHGEDALEAKERAAGTEIDGRKIRVDFSITERAHTPTPGVYLGRPSDEGYSRRGRGGGGSYGGGPGFYRQRGSPDYYYGGGGGRRRYSRSRSRSYSPRRY